MCTLLFLTYNVSWTEYWHLEDPHLLYWSMHLKRLRPTALGTAFDSLFIFITVHFIRFIYINSVSNVQWTGLSSFIPTGIWISVSKNG
jgi:hypothetical protein